MDVRRVLHVEDLTPGLKVVLVDRLGLLSRPLVRRAAAAGRLVVFRHAVHGVGEASWFRSAVEHDQLREFSCLPFESFNEYWRADDLAFDAVEAVYAVLKRHQKVPVSSLLELYRDENVELAFKKALLSRLAEFYRTVAALHLFRQDGKQVVFCPSAAWEEARLWLDLAEVRWQWPTEVTIDRSWRAGLIRFESSLDRLRWAGVVSILPLWILSGIRKVTRFASSPESIFTALRVYSTDWGFRGEGSREIDWLLDDHRVCRDNALFVIEKPVSKDYRAELTRRQYRFADISGREAFRRVSCRFLFRDLLICGMAAWSRLALAVFHTPGIFVEVAARGWFDYFRWTAFLEHWRPRHFVAYNHFHFDHLFRNARLRSAGCSSWYYVHSIDDRGAFYDASSAGAVKSQAMLGYLAYDYQIHWGRRDASWFRGMFGKSKKYLAIGPLWSAHIQSLPRVRALLKDRQAQEKIKTVTAIAVFDTSFNLGAPYDELGAQEFFDAIRELFDQPAWSSCLLLYKPKNDLASVRQGASTQMAASLDRLLAHPRCVLLDPEMSPEAVIAEADLTISMAFTSTTVEALGARRRALYFDPRRKFPQSYFDQFPSLVAHDRSSLARLCEYWLHMPEAEFQSYLDRYLAPEFGGHLDAGAVDRFRAALSRNGPAEMPSDRAALVHG